MGLGRPLEGVRRPAGPTFDERCFGTGSEGSEGRGPVGGAMDERAGRGSVVPDMLAVLLGQEPLLVLGRRCWANARAVFCFSSSPRPHHVTRMTVVSGRRRQQTSRCFFPTVCGERNPGSAGPTSATAASDDSKRVVQLERPVAAGAGYRGFAILELPSAVSTMQYARRGEARRCCCERSTGRRGL